MGFQNIPVWDLNGSDPYQTFSSTCISWTKLYSVLQKA